MKLISDIENLRQELSIDKWLLMGGSWGSTLALSYAETYPTRVSEMILFGVTTGRHQEFDWLFRGGVARFFPEQWDRLKSNVPPSLQHYDIVEAYSQLLNNPDPEVRQRAAQAWCEWESATRMAP
jgi:proline iminopeptidase